MTQSTFWSEFSTSNYYVNYSQFLKQVYYHFSNANGVPSAWKALPDLENSSTSVPIPNVEMSPLLGA